MAKVVSLLMVVTLAITLAACTTKDNSSRVTFNGPVTIAGCAVLVFPGGATVDAGSVTDNKDGTITAGTKTYTIAPDCSLRPIAVVPPVVTGS